MCLDLAWTGALHLLATGKGCEGYSALEMYIINVDDFDFHDAAI
jgi:hypothetical protein